MKSTVCAIFLCLTILPAVAAPPVWDSGVLQQFSVDQLVRLVGSVGVVDKTYTVVINGGDYTYFASHEMKTGNKLPAVTENAPVKYRVEGTNLFMFDDHGKQFKLGIVKRSKNVQ